MLLSSADFFQNQFFRKILLGILSHVRTQRGDRGSETPLKNHKFIGFPSNSGPDPHGNHKAAKSAFNGGPLSACQ